RKGRRRSRSSSPRAPSSICRMAVVGRRRGAPDGPSRSKRGCLPSVAIGSKWDSFASRIERSCRGRRRNGRAAATGERPKRRGGAAASGLRGGGRAARRQGRGAERGRGNARPGRGGGLSRSTGGGPGSGGAARYGLCEPGQGGPQLWGRPLRDGGRRGEG